MYYGHQPHTPSPDDRTIIQCPKCGWTSKELTNEDLACIGHPRYCGNEDCDGKATKFMTFAPHERDEAYAAMYLNANANSDSASS